MANNYGIDYASAILELAGKPVTPENLELMRQLYGLRYEKIKSDPEKYGQYDNDDIMRQAKIYMDKVPVTAGELDLDAIYQNRLDAAAQNLELARKANLQDYNYGAEQIDDGYDDIRRQIDLAYRINSLGNAEVLAAQGLGRGYGQAPTSGYGETSALSQYTNYANNIADSYNEQQRQKNELYYNMLSNNNQAAMQYNNLLDSVWASKGQDLYNNHWANANYMLNAQGHNAGVSDSYIKNNQAAREFAENTRLNWDNNAMGWDNNAINREKHNETVRSNMENEALQKKKIDNDYEYNMGSLNVNRHRYGL